jgi:acetyl esterase/lipase
MHVSRALASWLLIGALHPIAQGAQQTPAGPPSPAVAPGAYRVLPAVKLYAGVAPGSESWTIPESTSGQPASRVVRNVVSPDYVPYLPDVSRNTGTGVVIAPGGGFVMLSYDSEGVEVAQWLAERGVAAFVLKYRVRQTDPNQSPMAAIRAADEPSSNYEFGLADGVAAVKMIRERAADYGIKADKIVMLGFSAGAIVTVSTTLQNDVSARPNYAAPIYGAPFGAIPDLPPGLPPFFLAIAQDDNGAGALVDRFYAALLAKGYGPELHRFQSGGHGFGMSRRFTTADHWIDSFFWWMEANGLTRKPGDPERPTRPTPTGRSGGKGEAR